MKNPALIAIGGVLGTLLRWGIVEASPTSGSTSVIGLNLVGSLAIGWLAGSGLKKSREWALGAVGFCGGLTTFSTFAVEAASRLDNGDLLSGSQHVITTVIAALLAVLLGYWLAGRWPAGSVLPTSGTTQPGMTPPDPSGR